MRMSAWRPVNGVTAHSVRAGPLRAVWEVTSLVGLEGGRRSRRPTAVKLLEMVSTVDEQACWTLPAVPDTVGQLRAHVTAFAAAAGAPPELHDAVALAVSETVTNAV